MGNITQWITPAVSFQVRKEAKDTLAFDDRTFGNRLIRIDRMGVRSEVIRLTRPHEDRDPFA